MDAHITEALNIQRFMIVWDINLKITNRLDKLVICSPLFSLKPNESDKMYNIRLVRFADKLQILSNFSLKKEFKRCTTYMINPLTCVVLDVYKGFKRFSWDQNEWSEEMRFVFEVEMQCDSSAILPTVWEHCITDLKPAFYESNILYCTGDWHSTFANNQGVSCVVKSYTIDKIFHLEIEPVKPSGNWNLLTVMQTIENDNTSEWQYLQYNELLPRFYGRNFSDNCVPICIREIHEIITSFKKITHFEMVAITNIIKPNSTPSSNLIEPTADTTTITKVQLNSATDTKKLQYHQNLSSKLKEYFVANKFCDITIHVQDQQIRAHKIALSTGSIIWHDMLDENETLVELHIADFDYETIKALIEYMYTGNAKQITDQLLIAADKYGVAGLKELCEEELIKTIEMKTVINLLLMSDRYNATRLYDKILDFIGENREAFAELKETKGIFLMYPELGFKLYARFSIK